MTRPAGKAFAQHFPRSVVGGAPLLGEGHNFAIVPLVQFISMPEYLLLGHLPAVLALAPATQLGH